MSHRSALLVVLAAVLALFGAIGLRGHVVLAQPVHDEILDRLPGDEDSERTKSFRDQTTFYLPELALQLSGARSGWITTWNPHVGLGRPARHLGGLSRAWIVTNAVSFATRDPFVAYTLLAFLAVIGCAVFGHLLLRSMGLSPEAVVVGTLGLALGAYIAYWLTFVLYLWGVCWALALLWLVPGYLERRDWRRGVGIAFAVHSMILTAYPQQAVWSGWLLLLVAGRTFASRPRVRPALGLALWGALGIALSMPVILDTVWDVSHSARTDVDPSFFFDTLPPLAGPGDLATLAAWVFDATWFGNPVGHEYPFKVRGVSFTPAFAALLALSFAAGGWRRWWPWQVFLLGTFVVALWPAAYRFGIGWLGLGLSRHAPLAALHVPMAVLAACAVDRWPRVERPGRVTGSAVALVPFALALPGLFLLQAQVASGFFGASLMFLGGALAFVWTRRPAVIVVVTVLGTLHYAFLLRLEVPREEALRDTGITATIRAETEGGERYAWIGRPYRYLLRPNQEVLFDLRSVHSSDSISTLDYQAWALRISTGGTQAYGRQFRRLTDASLLDAEKLAAAGVGLLISHDDVPRALARRVHTEQGLGFWRTRTRPVLEAQLEGYGGSSPNAWTEGGVLGSRRHPIERAVDEVDRLVFRLTPLERETLLFVSQQYDERWTASTGGESLATVKVDDFFQGALVPPGTTEVVLEFRPLATWSWIPQVLLGLLVAAAFLRTGRAP